MVALFGTKIIYRTKIFLGKFENLFFNGTQSKEQIFYSTGFLTLTYDWKGVSTETSCLAFVLMAL
jgi:hypothetical protein